MEYRIRRFLDSEFSRPALEKLEVSGCVMVEVGGKGKVEVPVLGVAGAFQKLWSHAVGRFFLAARAPGDVLADEVPSARKLCGGGLAARGIARQ